jgi:hypothetical protein
MPQRLGHTLQRDFLPFVQPSHRVQKAHRAVRVPHAPPQRTRIEQVEVRIRENAEGDLVVRADLGAEHAREVREEAALEEALV